MTHRLASCLGALSLAADVANGFPPEKVLRTVIVAGGLARSLGLSPEHSRAAWWMPLLRYLGCTGFAWEEGVLYGAGDDRSVRHTMALADVAAPLQTLGSVVRGVAIQASWPARAAAVGRLLGDGRAIADHAAACVESAVWLARVAGFEDDLVQPLGWLETRWDGRGIPSVGGADIPLAVRIHHVADVAELAFHRLGSAGAVALVAQRAGGQLDPELCAAFVSVAPDLLARLEGSVWEAFLGSEVAPLALADEDRLDGLCQAFAHFTDLKSPWFAGHSHGVARLAERAGRLLAVGGEDRRALRRAALLHDLGRVAVNNAVWEKPGPLTFAEREAVRDHSLRTERILAASPLLSPLASLAAAAHERTDGAGYHRSLPSSVLPMTARVLAAADVRQALSEARPHRAALDSPAAARILADEAKEGRLDAEAVRAVLAAFGDADDAVAVTNPCGLSDREVEVLVLLARGGSNKDIAARLGLSPKTVQHHVANAYQRIGLRSRAAATLFVVDHGLLGRLP